MEAYLVNDQIRRRMKDLGFGDEYYSFHQHYVLQAMATIEIDANNQILIMIGETADVCIQSDFGIYDLTDTSLSKQDHEHQGTIILINYAQHSTHVYFMQAIPKNI